MITSLIFDFDGVLGLSREIAWEAGREILRVFGRDENISSMQDHRRLFGRAAQEALVGRESAEILREMHRLAMRSRACRIPPHSELLELLGKLECPIGIITAGYAETACSCLGELTSRFRFIRGRESGGKKVLLANCRSADFESPLYLGDTVRDIRRCRETGLPICATAWAYAFDTLGDLAAEQPDWLIRDLGEFQILLQSIHLLPTYEK